MSMASRHEWAGGFPREVGIVGIRVAGFKTEH
jgi:hypothetical protein